MVRMGVLVVIIEAFTGDVSPSPKVNSPWLNTIPSNEAMKSSSMSRLDTFSRLVNSEAIQNKAAAPAMRQSARINGVTALPKNTNFDTGDMNPHMVLAANMERCPFISFAFMLRMVFSTAKLCGICRNRALFTVDFLLNIFAAGVRVPGLYALFLRFSMGCPKVVIPHDFFSNV